MLQFEGFAICDVQTDFVHEEKFYSVAGEGDYEIVGKDGRGDEGEGCMNVDRDDFLKLKISEGCKKDVDIKILAEDVDI